MTHAERTADAERSATRLQLAAARRAEERAERLRQRDVETALRQRAALDARGEAVAAAAAAAAQGCEITGTVPQNLRGAICNLATSVHGGGEPVNELTVILRLEVATLVRLQSPDAEDAMLNILDAWMNGRNVRVARATFYYGRAHLATAQTRVFGAPDVEYH
ncbi:MAG: hypothetical protein OXG44_15830 [Gammaproteobacteria bacterium]|nr:hypothetical protein [Gammaproteobacteria bacterium]